MDEEMAARERERKGKGVIPQLSLGWQTDEDPEMRAKLERGRVRENEKAVLDSKAWTSFPESMFPSLLPFLAWDDVFRYHAVCRDWKSFLCSAGFRRSWQRAPDQRPICFASSFNTNSLWNPSTKKWQVSRDDLPPSLSAAQSDINVAVSSHTIETHFPVVSAVHGYVLIRMYSFDRSLVDVWPPQGESDSESLSEDVEYEGSTVLDPWPQHTKQLLLIVNPLLPRTKENIKAVRPFPYHPRHDCRHEIVWDPKFCRYELISRAETFDYEDDQFWYVVFRRYNFVFDRWEKIINWSAIKVMDLESSLIINGQLLVLGRRSPSSTSKIKPYRIYGMELSKSGSIEEMNLRAPIVPFRLGFAALFYYEGMYMLAGGEVENFFSNLIVSSFKVWKKREVFDSEDTWTEVSVMPSAMLRHLNDLSPENEFQCEEEGGFLCIANRKMDVVMCDLRKQLWFTLQNHPLGQDAAQSGLSLCDPRFDVPLPSSLGMNLSEL